MGAPDDLHFYVSRISMSPTVVMKQLRHSPLDGTTDGSVLISIITHVIKCQLAEVSFTVSVPKVVVRPA